MSYPRFSTIATILGNPVYWGSPHRDHTAEQLAALKGLGVNTLFVNLAWSRPWMDAVTLEQVHTSPSFPWLSDPQQVAVNAGRLRQRTDAVVGAGLRPFYLFGCPAYVNLAQVPPEHRAATEMLIGQRVSRIDPRISVLCIQHPAVRALYRELLQAHFAAFPETAGILFYTMDELAEVCDEQDACPRCHDIPLHDRLPDFLRFLRDVIDELKPGVEMWWEPWEFTATQTFAVAERLDPHIKLSLHSSIHEVYYVNQPDLWLRHLCRLAADRGTDVIVELFLSGTGEDLGPLPAYPCPRLVIEQLRSVAELPAVVGIKEYFGTVAEHISVNEQAWQAFLARPDAGCDILLRDLAEAYTPGEGDRPSPVHGAQLRSPETSSPGGIALLTAWEEAARAIEVFPWDVSWRLRHYNSVRYDQAVGQGYWSRSFTASLPTPWATPSWESSRSAAYIVSATTAGVTPRLIEETGQRLERSVAHLDRALAHLVTAQAHAAADRRADLARQADSVRLFRGLTLSRRWHLRASQLAARLRAAPSAALTDALEACLRADLRNGDELLAVMRSGGYQGFDVPVFEKTLGDMASELEAFRRQPESWVQTHLTDDM